MTLVICTLLFLRQFIMGTNLLPKHRFFAVLYRIVNCFRQHVLQLTHSAKTALHPHVDTDTKQCFYTKVSRPSVVHDYSTLLHIQYSKKLVIQPDKA